MAFPKYFGLFFSFYMYLFFVLILPTFANEKGRHADDAPKTNNQVVAPIDLSKCDWYAVPGHLDPKNMNQWQKAKDTKPLQNQIKKVKKFPVFLNEIFPVSEDHKTRNSMQYSGRRFTLIARLYLTPHFIRNIKSPALIFPGIGENWAIFWNGQKIMSCPFCQSQQMGGYKKNLIVPLPSDPLTKNNILAIHVSGYGPSLFTHNFLFGLNASQGYMLGEVSQFIQNNNQWFRLMLIGVYLLFGLYHIFFFARRPQTLYNLYFGLFSISLGAYFFFFANTAFDLIHDSRLIILGAYFAQPLALLFFHLFLHFFLWAKQRISKTQYILFALNILIMLALVIGPYQNYQTILMIWYFLAVPQIAHIIYSVSLGIRKGKRDAQYLALSGGIILICMLWDILDTVLFHTQIRLMKYSYSLFVLALTAVLANRFVNLQKRTESLNAEMRTVNKRLRVSEFKYRSLVDSFQDIIFVLDQDQRFVSCNSSLKKMLGYNENEILGRLFTDIVFSERSEQANTLQLEFIKNEFTQLFQEKTLVNFKAYFCMAHINEPKELDVTLQYQENEGRVEILGRISQILEDSLLNALFAEKQTYLIDNFLGHAEIISRKLTQKITRYVPVSDAKTMRISLREMILNAIEHGNLNISFAEKTKALEKNEYMNLVRQRREDERYKYKKVTVAYIMDQHKIMYYIKDNGRGFDHKKYTQNQIDMSSLNEQGIAHGRGIIMAFGVFDAINYNEKGNAVTLVKYLS